MQQPPILLKYIYIWLIVLHIDSLELLFQKDISKKLFFLKWKYFYVEFDVLSSLSFVSFKSASGSVSKFLK